MATVRISTRTGNAVLNAWAQAIDAGSAAGTISIYDGAMPATANTAPSGQRLLATIAFSRPAYLAASNVRAAANTILPQDAVLSGQASWARIADGDGNAIFDCDVGDQVGATIVLNTTALVANGPVAITSFSLIAG